jgi:hypothetical protein
MGLLSYVLPHAQTLHHSRDQSDRATHTSAALPPFIRSTGHTVVELLKHYATSRNVVDSRPNVAI